MDAVITPIDFSTLLSQDELRLKRAEEKARTKKNRILSVETSHFLIYHFVKSKSCINQNVVL